MPNVTVQKTCGKEENFPLGNLEVRKFEEIQRRAFELFEQRGCESDRELEDWLTAEREILNSVPPELKETGNAYELEIPLPGVAAKDVQVFVVPNGIGVQARSKQEKRSEEDKVLWTELSSEELYRQFQIPNPIDVDRTTAMLEKGLLHIRAPKATPTEQSTGATAG